MLVGIKYCGGCRASFDRSLAARRVTEAVSEITGMARDSVLFVTDGSSRHYDVLLAICGCKTVCPDLSRYDFERLVIIDDADSVRKAVTDITSVADR